MAALNITIEEVTPEVDGKLYKCIWKANVGIKKAWFYEEDIFNFLTRRFYEEGLRAGEVKDVFTKSLVHKEYKYITAFLESHHSI